jgi:hypothetical protein
VEDTRGEVEEGEEAHVDGLFRNQFIYILPLEILLNQFKNLLMHHIPDRLPYP